MAPAAWQLWISLRIRTSCSCFSSFDIFLFLCCYFYPLCMWSNIQMNDESHVDAFNASLDRASIKRRGVVLSSVHFISCLVKIKMRAKFNISSKSTTRNSLKFKRFLIGWLWVQKGSGLVWTKACKPVSTRTIYYENPGFITHKNVSATDAVIMSPYSFRHFKRNWAK